jgi:hypothetical protein
MPADSSFHTETIITRGLHNLAFADKPTIKVLLYTDDPQEVVRETGRPLGLGSMIGHLGTHPLAFANLSIQLKSRYPNGAANNGQPVQRINTVIEQEEQTGQPFDEVWFFGLHQINKTKFELGINGGGPDSELDEAEVLTLRRIMDGGVGVLVTGDHANARPLDARLNPDSPCPDDLRDQPLGLGRALGRCIPRAGKLRDWEGDPTSDQRHSFNTQVVNFGSNIDTETGFQQDEIAQQLVLRTYNERGRPSLEGRPHPLFLHRRGAAIQLFPDHLHEGAITLPEDFETEEWPKTAKNYRPKPEVVAHGLDKRNGRKLNLVAAYNGDMVNVGRIVADSTWHHYFNINLRGFPAVSQPDTAADQIGQFYANLALWLAPRTKRHQMADAMLRWIRQQPAIAELVGPVPSKRDGDILVTGRLAMKFLVEVASDCEIHELLQTLLPEETARRYQSLYFPERSNTLSPLPSKELLMGSTIHEPPQETVEIMALATFSEARFTFRVNAVSASAEMAFKRHRMRVEQTMRRARRFFPDAGI